MQHCYICYSSPVDEDFVCDRCENHYCEDCSYTYSLHYQFQGSRCHWCSDQPRLIKLTQAMVRSNKIKLLIGND